MRLTAEPGTTTRASVRLLAVEGEDPTVQHWRRVLEPRGIDVVAAGSCARARELIAGAHPSEYRYAFLNGRLPDGDGLQLVPVLNALEPPPGTAVISACLEPCHFLSLQESRVVVMPKPLSDEMIIALIGVLECRVDSVAAGFAKRLRLSGREAQVVAGWLAGRSTSAIAEALRVRPSTIDEYWNRIRTKAGVPSREDIFRLLVRFD